MPEAGAVSSVQLHHGGRRQQRGLRGAGEGALGRPGDGATALSTAEVHQAVADFVAAGGRAETAGFDGIERHGAHGYLVGAAPRRPLVDYLADDVDDIVA